MKLRRVAILAAHFVPSNLAAVHRARLWAQSLAEFGWEPVIVTTDARYYEEKLDLALEKLLAPDLKIVRTAALPTRPVRLLGEIGLRSLPWHYRALSRLAARREIDFLHITVPSHFSALLGRLIHARHGLPYGIDYIDPWVHRWPGTEVLLSKAWWSCHLGEWLEPWAVRRASLITGVAPLYYEAVLERNPALRSQVVTAAMPYGASSVDFEMARASGRRPFLFDPDDGLFHVVYAGAMLPRAYPVLERLLQAVADFRRQDPARASRLRLHFIGTGKQPDDPNGHNIAPFIERHGLVDCADEHPARIGYLDVLAHLQGAAAILVLGSTEPHYSPSKIFQSVQARRPILAVLHEDSTALQVLEGVASAVVVKLTAERLPLPGGLAEALGRLMALEACGEGTNEPAEFESFSARGSARALAAALDEAMARDACAARHN